MRQAQKNVLFYTSFPPEEQGFQAAPTPLPIHYLLDNFFNPVILFYNNRKKYIFAL